MQTDAKIFVAGHRGLVGGAILRRLKTAGFTNLLCRSHRQLDLRNQAAVARFFQREQPEYVFLAAARVGGIRANSTYPAQFIYDNLMIESNIIHQAYLHGVKKLLFLGSSCIYPKFAPQPMKEEYLLDGKLEPTNEPYAVAKIAGIKMCQAYNRQYGTCFISAMPTNLYGPGDNFDLLDSHVIPALMRRFHLARVAETPEVTVWGTGAPRREFLHVDDLADACLFLMEHYQGNDFINVGVGEDLTIRELAELIAGVTGFKGRLSFDPDQPDGTPRKLLDVSRLTALGWQARIPLKEGLRSTYRWFCRSRWARQEADVSGSPRLSRSSRNSSGRFETRPDSSEIRPVAFSSKNICITLFMRVQIKSLQQRLIIFLVLPVVIFLSAMGTVGYVYIRDSLFREWQQAAILRLERAAHSMDMRLSEPIQWMQNFAKTGSGQSPEENQRWILQQLRQLPGVSLVTLTWGTGPGNEIFNESGPWPEAAAKVARVSPPEYLYPPGQGVVGLQSQLLDDGGRPLGQLDVFVKFDYLMADVLASGWLHSNMACLVNPQGHYLAHSDPAMAGRHCLGETPGSPGNGHAGGDEGKDLRHHHGARQGYRLLPVARGPLGHHAARPGQPDTGATISLPVGLPHRGSAVPRGYPAAYPSGS